MTLPLDRLIGSLARTGMTRFFQRLFNDYPDLKEEDLQQALAFAAATVDGTIDLHLDAA